MMLQKKYKRRPSRLATNSWTSLQNITNQKFWIWKNKIITCDTSRNLVSVTFRHFHDRSNAYECMLTIFCLSVVSIRLYELACHSNESDVKMSHVRMPLKQVSTFECCFLTLIQNSYLGDICTTHAQRHQIMFW